MTNLKSLDIKSIIVTITISTVVGLIIGYLGVTFSRSFQTEQDFHKDTKPSNIEEYNDYVCHELNTLKRPIIIVGYSETTDLILRDGNGTLHYYSQSGITNAIYNTYAKGDTINGKGTNIESPDVLIMDAVVGDYSYEELARKIRLSKN